MPVQVPIQKRRIKWLACKMLSAAGVLETDEPQRASVFNQVAASIIGLCAAHGVCLKGDYGANCRTPF